MIVKVISNKKNISVHIFPHFQLLNENVFPFLRKWILLKSHKNLICRIFCSFLDAIILQFDNYVNIVFNQNILCSEIAIEVNLIKF